jgi:hypothetical protein
MASTFDDEETDRQVSSTFRVNKSLDELAEEQRVSLCVDAAELAGDWPPEDSIDEFLAFVREIRR